MQFISLDSMDSCPPIRGSAIKEERDGSSVMNEAWCARLQQCEEEGI
jgi:hypothetical protein